METKNAIIKSAIIEIEDHGILTAWLNLDYGGGGQGFGGYALQSNGWDEPGPNIAGLFIRRVLDTVGVREWNSLEGQTIRVKAEQAKIHEIGHIIKDDWFNPSEEFKNLK